MRRTFFIPIALSFLLAPSLLPAAPGIKVAPQDDVVASVNNEPITREALVKRILSYYGTANLESMINQTLVRQAADREKITVTDAEIEERVSRLRSMMRTPELFQQWLRESGLTEQHYRDQVRYTLLTEKIVLKHTPTSESDLDRVRVRIILVQTEAEAKEIQQSLKQGSDFIQLAKEKSIDTTTGQTGGLMPDFMRVDYPEVWQAVAGLKPGEVSPPVKLSSNYALVKLDDRLPASSLDPQQRERDRQRLLNYRMNAWLDTARKQAKITYPMPLNLP